jgi:GNAT superfamily N-acetyltransferase
LTVRTATRADIPALCELLCLLFNQEAEFHADTGTQVAGLQQIIDAPDMGRILILGNGETVDGMVNLLFTVSTALGGRVAILEDMVVRPDRRGGGAGSQLLRAAIELCRSCACRRITLLTDRNNDAAQGFYARHGFDLSDMVPMRLLL